MGISCTSLDNAVIGRGHILWVYLIPHWITLSLGGGIFCGYVLHLIRERCHWEEAYFVGISYTSLDNAGIGRRDNLICGYILHLI